MECLALQVMGQEYYATCKCFPVCNRKDPAKTLNSHVHQTEKWLEETYKFNYTVNRPPNWNSLSGSSALVDCWSCERQGHSMKGWHLCRSLPPVSFKRLCKLEADPPITSSITIGEHQLAVPDGFNRLLPRFHISIGTCHIISWFAPKPSHTP